jgi:hypothetical protein
MSLEFIVDMRTKKPTESVSLAQSWVVGSAVHFEKLDKKRLNTLQGQHKHHQIQSQKQPRPSSRHTHCQLLAKATQ